MMTWVFAGGKPDEGGAKVGGWGHNGGLRAKIVPCSAIPKEYHFPSERYDCDHIDAQGVLQNDAAWELWHSLTSLLTESGSTSCPPETTPTTSGAASGAAPVEKDATGSKTTTSKPGQASSSSACISGATASAWLLLIVGI